MGNDDIDKTIEAVRAEMLPFESWERLRGGKCGGVCGVLYVSGFWAGTEYSPGGGKLAAGSLGEG
ncbi:hypothetical protein AGMMS4952_07930 [Spirochaetia bacterium]|nr:hypothetical protein AGMMS4952_07930 [Spirochaetia bacterium]